MPTVIDGSTGVSAVQNGVVQQADLAANIAGNGPCFSAYQSVAQSIPSSVETKLAFQTKEFDTANAFDNVTNYRFQPTIAGYYQINAEVTFIAPAGNPTTYVIIRKSGISFKSGASINPVGTAPRLPASALVYLNGSTDYLEIAAYQNTGSALNTISGSTLSYFQGCLVRAA